MWNSLLDRCFCALIDQSEQRRQREIRRRRSPVPEVPESQSPSRRAESRIGYAENKTSLTGPAREYFSHLISQHRTAPHRTSHHVAFYPASSAHLNSLHFDLYCCLLACLHAPSPIPRSFTTYTSNVNTARCGIRPPARTGPRYAEDAPPFLPPSLPHYSLPSFLPPSLSSRSLLRAALSFILCLFQWRTVWHLRQDTTRPPPARSQSLHGCLVPRSSRPRLTLRNKA